MPNGGARPGSGRKKKIVEGPELPPRRRGRPTNAEKAAREAAQAAWAAEQAQLGLASADAPAPVSGGAKPGLYTPQMAPDVVPLDYFLTLMRDPNVSAERRDRAAQVAIGFTTAKPGEKKLGKKEQQLETARGLTSGGGKFGGGKPPLSVVAKEA